MITAQKRLDENISNRFQSLSQTSVPEVVQHSPSLYLLFGLVMGAISSVLMISYAKKSSKIPELRKNHEFSRLKQNDDEEFNQVEKLC